MAQLFPPAANLAVKVALWGGALGLAALSWGGWAWSRSAYATRQNMATDQPVPFSHKHHVQGLGLDCRYCHSTVESEPSAGMPSVSVCMTCHSQVWTHAPMLAPVREAYRERRPILWSRVYKLPDFVYFNHSVHVHKGVACVTCHGRVDQMPLTEKATPLHMQWCMQCHRQPQPHLRPREGVFTMDYQGPEQGWELALRYHLRSQRERTDCTTCHR